MYGYIVSLVVFLTIASALPPVKRLPPVRRWLAAGLLAVLATLPIFSGCSIGGYCRGIIGDLSITTLLFLSVPIYSNLIGSPLPAAFTSVQLKTVLGVLALVFYPMSLGSSVMDPYWLGYQPEPLIIFTLTLGLLACWSGYYFIAMVMIGVQLAYSLRIMESTNFWDYLLDPAIALYCIASLPKTATQIFATLRRPPKSIALPSAGYAKETQQETI